MAQITQVKLVDDLDGGEASESVAFSLDGRFYEIDLSDQHAAALRGCFRSVHQQCPPGGQRLEGGVAAADVDAGGSVAHEDTAAVREWANANGLEVSTRGRISTAVLEAYENRGNAHATPAVATAPAAAPVTEPAVEAVVDAETKPKRRARKKATAES